MLPLSARRLSQAPSPLLRRSASAVTQLSPTIRVAAVNPAGSLTTSISVVLQAGSRYEAKAGVANVLKNLSFKVGSVCRERRARGVGSRSEDGDGRWLEPAFSRAGGDRDWARLGGGGGGGREGSSQR